MQNQPNPAQPPRRPRRDHPSWKQINSQLPPPVKESDGHSLFKILLASAVLVLGFAVGILTNLRPTESQLEKRTLTEFPSFTWSSFLSGEYTSAIETWYADTFPGREAMLRANGAIQSLYGLRGEQLTGGPGNAEDIPDDENDPVDWESFLASLESETEPPVPGNEEESSSKEQETDPAPEQSGNIYLVGDSAYDLYFFGQTNSMRYAYLMNQAAEQLKGVATVYDMIVPLSYSINLTPETQQKLGVSDGEDAINYMFGKMSEDVVKVRIFENLYRHRDEYLYFRTDHHWTALAAYYAYEAFCRASGQEATPLSDYEKLAFEGFVGTHYAASGNNAKLSSNPDTVYAYVPNGTNTIAVTERNGKTTNYSVVNRATDAWYKAANSKYNCFIAGDNPLSVVHNSKIQDGSSIVVVKESFGNALIPFLVDQYEYVYVLDYRYYTGSLADFVKEKNAQQVLFINNLSATGAAARLNEMDRLLK